MYSEEEFIKNAVEFLNEIGVDTAELGPETNLIDTGVLDSLAILTFLDFLEQQWDKEVDVDELSIDSISTLRRAYRFMEG